MIRVSVSEMFLMLCIPRESGDDPNEDIKGVVYVEYSPRERG